MSNLQFFRGFVRGDLFVHSGELGGGTSSDLLGAELNKLGLELIKLLLQVLLVLAPEGAGLDFGGLNSLTPCQYSSDLKRLKQCLR